MFLRSGEKTQVKRDSHKTNVYLARHSGPPEMTTCARKMQIRVRAIVSTLASEERDALDRTAAYTLKGELNSISSQMG